MTTAVAVGTPRNITSLGVTGIGKIGYEKRLREDKVKDSVFCRVPTSYRINRRKEIDVENLGCIMQIPGSGSKGPDQSVIMTMALPLNQAPVVGPGAILLNNEEDRDLRYAKFYYQEIKKAVKQWEYGLYSNETKYLDLNSGNPQALKRYWAELFDLRCHQALVMTSEDALCTAPTSLSQTLNPHFLIPNRALPRVLWNKTAPTKTTGAADSKGWYSSGSFAGGGSYVEDVVEALMAANGTGSTPLCLPNQDLWAMIAWYTENVQMFEKVEIDGIPTVLLLCPPHIIDWAMNPSNNSSGNIIGNLHKPDVYMTKNRECFPGEVGRIKDSILLIKDTRYVTLTISGSNGSYAVTPGYQYPGNYNMQNVSAWANTSGATNYSFDCIIGLGGNGLAEYLVDPLNTDLSEFYNYKQIKGLGSYEGSGMQIPRWDLDEASAADGASATLIHRGSFVVPVGRVQPFNIVS
ncbi:MAG: hypothetical protein PHE17_18080 [Thiothrix sp.]|uniref:hypothetical protein n=1 Tax=Thiothrix sp. TaxID=1032 RepID=UPI0026247689|nr:hypothetical protein [Thiothrix sp.]MDD5394930.1 hypothetical protein [Thiothrix sp.]